MSTSLPEDPIDIVRAKSTTPQSPKPIHIPSPSLIPNLENHMDPSLNVAVTADPSLTIPSVSDIPDQTNAIPMTEGPVESSFQPEAVIAQSDNEEPNAVGAPADDVQLSGNLVPSESGLNELLATEQPVEPADHASGDPTLTQSEEVGPQPPRAIEFGVAAQPQSTNAPANPLPIGTDLTTPTGGVDIAALLNTLAPQLQALPQTQPTLASHGISDVQSTSTLPIVPLNAALPPRPQSNNAPGYDSSPNPDQSSSLPSIPQNYTQAPVLRVGQNGLPPPPSASFQQSGASYPLPSPSLPRPLSANDDEGPFPPEVEALYQDFLSVEKRNVTDAKWEKFPDGSRLFIGNLPTEKVTKQDVFRKFYKYGQLAQISLKQAYGFVQFMTADTCAAAKESEQDKPLKGRKMHLEISRPQGGKRDKDRNNNNRRRSRSPDFNRNRADRYTGSAASPRDRDGRRGRDDYRPGRSPSPRGYRRNRSPDRYDNRRRSRSHSPYGRDRNRHEDSEDSLPLPRRAPHEVPEVQVLVLDTLDRNFIKYIEDAFNTRGVRCDVLLLSPRLNEEAVIRRQVLEGVQGVVRLTRANQETGRLSLLLFDRRSGAQSVKFEQYENLDPNIAIELVIRARQTHQLPSYQPAPTTYGIPPSYGIQSAPTTQPALPDYSSVLSQFGGRPDLQALLSTIQLQQSAGNATALPTQDVAQLLAAAANPQPQAYAHTQQKPSVHDYASLLGTNAPQQAVTGAMQHANGQQAGGQQQPDMQTLMAQLSQYHR